MHTKKLPTTLLAFLWYFVKQHWILFFGAQLFSFAWSIDHTIWPYIIGLIIDSITDINTDRSQVWSVLATPLWMGAILWISVEISFRLQGFFLAKVLPKISADVRMAMFDYVQNHSYSYFSNNFSGTIANKISDMVLSIDNILRLIIQLFFCYTTTGCPYISILRVTRNF